MELDDSYCCVILGDVFVDVQANDVKRLPSWNTDTEASSIEVLPGGSAANTARQLHALLKSNVSRTCPVKFVSSIGNDYFGSFFKSICQNEELICQIHELSCPTSVCMCLSGPLDRAFVSCYSSTDALAYSHIESHIPPNTTHVHIGGFFNLIGLHTAAFVDGCQKLKSKGVTISISTQYDPREKWTGENSILKELLPLCDVLFVNEAELEKLLPVLGNLDVIVVETRGEKGSRLHLNGVKSNQDGDVSSNDEVIVVKLEHVVDSIVDATGAGDSFIAGFLEVWMKEVRRKQGIAFDKTDSKVVEKVIDCCKRGHRVAGLNVQRLGACRQPISIEELED